jgi:hypothetical protein
LPGQAAEWSAEPRISLRSGYNDNVRLTTAKHDSVWEVAVTPAVKFGVAKENQGLFGNADFRVRRYYGGSGANSSSNLDREDYHFKVDTYHRTERNDLGANIDITRDSTLDSELDETGQAIQQRATRIRTTLGPSWTTTLNPRTRLSFEYRHSSVEYSDDPGVTDLVEYKYNTLNSSLTRQFTPLVQGTLSASYSQYKPDTKLESKSTAIRAGISRRFSETLSTSWLAGWRNTKSDNLVATGICFDPNTGTIDPGAKFPKCKGEIPIQTGTDKDNTTNSGSVFNVSIDKRLETGSLGASLTRQTVPSGSNGELLDVTSLRLTGAHRFTEKLTSSLNVEWISRETIVSSTGNPDKDKRKFFRIRPRLSWRLQREWSLSGEYEYARDDEDFNAGTATRNAFYLTLSYRPTKISISR